MNKFDFALGGLSATLAVAVTIGVSHILVGLSGWAVVGALLGTGGIHAVQAWRHR
jgi:hypothetical protein